MNELDNLLSDGDVKEPGKCKIIKIISGLPDKYKDALQFQLDDHGQFTGIGIARRCKAAGFPVSDAAIIKHRNRKCSCYGWVKEKI